MAQSSLRRAALVVAGLVVGASPAMGADVCEDPASQKFGAVFSGTASAQVIAGVPGSRVWICSVSLSATTAGTATLVEGTGATCATGQFLLDGWSVPVNGIVSLGNGAGTVVNPSSDANSAGANLCLILTSTGQTYAHITYARQ